jgi:hypothetical protein
MNEDEQVGRSSTSRYEARLFGSGQQPTNASAGKWSVFRPRKVRIETAEFS